jgi:hypothetical protein
MMFSFKAGMREKEAASGVSAESGLLNTIKYHAGKPDTETSITVESES